MFEEGCSQFWEEDVGLAMGDIDDDVFTFIKITTQTLSVF